MSQQGTQFENVSRVYSREEIFWGDNTREMPDLCVGFNIEYRVYLLPAIHVRKSQLLMSKRELSRR